jgi:hypothetical protein
MRTISYSSISDAVVQLCLLTDQSVLQHYCNITQQLADADAVFIANLIHQ